MKKVGLALGSGGARGLAHIGLIRALEEAEIPIATIAGASIGAFVGAFYVAEELDDLEEFFMGLDWQMLMSYFDVVFPVNGLLNGNRVCDLLSDHLLDMKIESSPIPFCCIATDLITGAEVQIRSGALVDAVRASISIPGIFTPFERGGHFLGDGGIVNPIPVDAAKSLGAEFVIAVNLNHTRPIDADTETSKLLSKITARRKTKTKRSESLFAQVLSHYETVKDSFQQKIAGWQKSDTNSPNIFEIIGTTISIMEQKVTASRLAECPPDYLIEFNLQEFGIFDFHQAETIIQKGYEQTQRQLPQILSRLT